MEPPPVIQWVYGQAPSSSAKHRPAGSQAASITVKTAFMRMQTVLAGSTHQTEHGGFYSWAKQTLLLTMGKA